MELNVIEAGADWSVSRHSHWLNVLLLIHGARPAEFGCPERADGGT